jgi:cell division septum initiation protein DivIVA
LREIQLLAEENQRLKQQNAELEAVLRMTEERKSSPPAANNAVASTLPAQHAFGSAHTVIDVTMLKRWHLILLASVLLLTFALGGWLVDWGVRRRHGGFRV